MASPRGSLPVFPRGEITKGGRGTSLIAKTAVPDRPLHRRFRSSSLLTSAGTGLTGEEPDIRTWPH